MFADDEIITEITETDSVTNLVSVQAKLAMGFLGMERLTTHVIYVSNLHVL